MFITHFMLQGAGRGKYLPETTMVLCDECHKINHDFAADFENLGPAPWERYAALEIQRRLWHNDFDIEELAKMLPSK